MFILLILLLLFILLSLATTAFCWYVANRLLSRKPAAKSVVITAMDTTTITLPRTKITRRPGIYGLTGNNGDGAIIGPILDSTPTTVTRQLIQVAGAIAPQAQAVWNTTVYGGKLREHLELAINEVSLPGPLGDLPAWLVPGTTDTWAILVHGSTARREQTLRVCKTLADFGLNLLIPTYRNDEGAPSSGPSRLGMTEWQDIEAAVKYAVEQGAKHVLLYGWSMGGTIVQLFLSRSDYASHTTAVVLDSPVLDWHEAILHLTKKNSLPLIFARLTQSIVAMRTGINFSTFRQLSRQAQMNIPILLFHGTNDVTAPIEISEDFASKNANVVYHRVEGADHTQCWNTAPEKYEAELRTFLQDVVK